MCGPKKGWRSTLGVILQWNVWGEGVWASTLQSNERMRHQIAAQKGHRKREALEMRPFELQIGGAEANEWANEWWKMHKMHDKMRKQTT